MTKGKTYLDAKKEIDEFAKDRNVELDRRKSIPFMLNELMKPIITSGLNKEGAPIEVADHWDCNTCDKSHMLYSNAVDCCNVPEEDKVMSDPYFKECYEEEELIVPAPPKRTRWKRIKDRVFNTVSYDTLMLMQLDKRLQSLEEELHEVKK